MMKQDEGHIVNISSAAGINAFPGSSTYSLTGEKLTDVSPEGHQTVYAYDDLDRFILRPPFIGHTFAFADAPAAMRLLQSGTSVGKVVLTVP